jgi:cellulose biosynthesis protein BcsQ
VPIAHHPRRHTWLGREAVRPRVRPCRPGGRSNPADDRELRLLDALATSPSPAPALEADALLIPALAADLDVRGAGKLYDLVEGEIPGLRILGVLLAASERRWPVTRDATNRMTADEMRVLPVQVPRAVRVASAPRHRAPTVVLEPDSMVSHAYRQLAHHLLGELGR